MKSHLFQKLENTPIFRGEQAEGISPSVSPSDLPDAQTIPIVADEVSQESAKLLLDIYDRLRLGTWNE
jgi:hypothetical protein